MIGAGTRAIWRLAARDARRDRGRSLLVLVIVALPVAGLVAATTVTDSGSATVEENATGTMGRADVTLTALTPSEGGPDTDEGIVELLDGLPASSEVEVHRILRGAVPDDGLSLPVTITDASLAPDALVAGQHELVEGERPTSGDAVSVSVALADRADLDIGDQAVLEPLGEVTVVGIHRLPEQLSRVGAVVAPGTLEGREDALATVLLDLPEGTDAAAVLGDRVALDGAAGPEDTVFHGTTREAVLQERFGRSERWLFVIVGGLAAVEVALVAGAAFAVSVRRRQRELGLLAATGGTRRHVRRSVLLSGATVGIAGALVGTVVGIAGSWAAMPLISASFDRVVSGLRVAPFMVAIAAALGVVAALLGAWWPARSVARLPVLTALSGRRPTPARSSSGLIKGVLLVALGGAVCLAAATFVDGNPFIFLAGSVAVVLGAGLTSPWLLEQLGRTARFLPAGPRLAVRDAARFRTRNGPIVTAAMAGLAATVTVGAVIASMDRYEAQAYEPALPTDVLLVQSSGVQGAAEVVATAVGQRAWPLVRPVADVARAGSFAPDADGMMDAEHVDSAAVAPELAAALAGEAAAEDLRAGRAVAIAPTDVDAIELRPYDPATGEPSAADAVTFDVVEHTAGATASHWQLPDVLLPNTDVVRDAVDDQPDAWTEHLLVFDGPVDAPTIRAASSAAADLGPEVSVAVEQGFESDYATLDQVVTVVGGIAGLAIVAVAIALAAAESRGDLRTLAAVGAGRRTRRSLAAGRALLLSGLGAVLAIPVGLVPAASLLTTVDGGVPLVLPWRPILVVAVLVPVLATTGAVLASRREPAGLTRAA